MGLIVGLTRIICVWLSVIQGINGIQWELKNASDFPINNRNWDIKNNFCRLCAHSSVLLDDTRIILHAGQAKFKVQKSDRPGDYWEVPDLHGALVTLDLTKDFKLSEEGFMTIKREKEGDDGNGGYISVANRAHMWRDSLDNIYVAGGHFFAQPYPKNWTYWEGSQYYLERKKIPGYTLWRYNINSDDWTQVQVKEPLRRLASSGYTSIPSTNTSYAFGGYISNRTGTDTPPAHMFAANGMVIYDHTTNTAKNISDPEDFGYTHARMHHLGPFDDPKPKHKGLLLILPGKKYNLSDTFEENISGGLSYGFEAVKFFDLEKNQFYEQRTTSLNGDMPSPRTRFCSVLVSEEGKWGWDLWIYGGQSSDDPNDPNQVLLSDMWVLSMPAFVWIRVPKLAGDDLRRSHTCHAVGGQMLILGGYPPGHYADPTVKCDTQLVQLFDLNNWSWNAEFKTNTKYVRHSDISKVQPNAFPLYEEWGDPVLKALLDTPTSAPTPTPPPPSRHSPIGAIVGGILGGLALLLVIIIIYVKKRKDREAVSKSTHFSEIFKSELPVNDGVSTGASNPVGSSPSSILAHTGTRTTEGPTVEAPVSPETPVDPASRINILPVVSPLGTGPGIPITNTIPVDGSDSEKTVPVRGGGDENRHNPSQPVGGREKRRADSV